MSFPGATLVLVQGGAWHLPAVSLISNGGAFNPLPLSSLFHIARLVNASRGVDQIGVCLMQRIPVSLFCVFMFSTTFERHVSLGLF